MAKSINPKYNEICEKETNSKFCKFCEGTSGLSREQEEKYLEIRIQQYNNKTPNIFTQLINFSNSVGRHVLNGSKIVDEKILKERLNICENCDKYIVKEDKCSLCGCFLKIKASWPEQKCPLNKW